MKIRSLTALLFLKLACALQAQTPILIQEQASITRTGEPVTLGLPFAPGKLRAGSSMRITDATGQDTPAQFQPMAYWNDGSVKWLKCDFLADVAANTQTTYWFEQKTATSIVSPLVLDGTQEEFVITTGPMRFVVDRTRFNLFRLIWLDLDGDGQFDEAEEILKSDSPGPNVSVGNQIYRTDTQAPAEIVVEEQGPAKIVLRISGRHSNGSTQSLKYETRITAFAGQTFVKIWHVYANGSSVHNMGNSLDPSLNATFDRYALDFNLNLTGEKKARFGICGAPPAFEAPLNQNDAPFKLKQHSRTEENPWLFTISQDNTTQGMGTQADGWGQILDNTWGMTFGSRYFWQKNPKGLSISADGQVSIEQAPVEQTLYVGMGTGDEIWLDFHQNENADAATAAMHARLTLPLFAHTSTQQYADSKAFYDLFPGNAPYPGMQNYIETVTTNHVNNIALLGLYGALHFGDTPRSYWEASTDAIDLSVWGNNYYDANILTPARLFCQTGNLRYVDIFVPGARHWMETACWNSNDPTNFVYGFCPAYSAYHREIDHFQQHYGEGIWYYYYLTGDERAKEIGLRAANSIVFQQEWANQNVDCRMAYQRASACLEAWKATGDSTYFKHAHYLLVDKILDKQDQYGLIGAHYIEGGEGLRGEQTFMMALYSDALWKLILEYPESSTERKRLSQKLALLADMVDKYARKAPGVEDYWNFFGAPNDAQEPTPDTRDFSGDETVYWYGRGLIAGLYAYAFDLTDEAHYKQLAENLLTQHWSDGGIDWSNSELWCKATGQGMKNMLHAVAIMNEGISTVFSATNYPGSAQFRLEQNYPNPFNPVTRFRYSLGSGSRVGLRV
ncbi:hypothetical protein KC799_26910, partial [candidate division KSB1 bacterium]|nr:hypothetical protein [candidate division KSB1 bacterium]